MAWKRMISVLLLWAVLLSAAGCNQLLTPSLGETYTDYPGVELRIEGVEQSNGELTLKTRWCNATNQEVMYGAAYVVEREENGQWRSCKTKDENISFIAIGYLLEADSSQEKNYTVSNIYDITEPGTYRIRANCWLDSKQITVWAVFSMEETVEGTAASVTTLPEEPTVPAKLAYTVQYIRTDGGDTDTVFPSVAVIESVEQLQAYYERNREIFNLERRDKVYADDSIGFLDACDSYTEAFFQEHYLILYRVEEGSGSVRHKVSKVEQTENGKLLIQVDPIIPEVGTCDMAQWHIILEMERHGAVPAAEDIEFPVPPDCAEEPVAGTVYTKPPALTVVSSDGSIQAERSTYSWFYTDESGKGNGICVDALPPLECRDYVTPFYASGEVKLLFEEMPDSVAVRCWSDQYWNSSNAKESQVTLEGGVLLTLNPGGYIYEITANWNREDRAYGGEVIYYFYAVSYTVNYQQDKT